MTFEIPIRTRSLTNLRWHWAKKAKMAKEHRAATALAFRVGIQNAKPDPDGVWVTITLPMVVSLARIAPCALDDDNLRGALKHVRDQVAACFRTDDRDPRIEWRYSQEKGKPKTYAVRVTIEERRDVLDAAEPTPEQLARWKGPR